MLARLQSLSRAASSLVEGWRKFWFTPGDPTTLGLIRLCAGAVLCYIFVMSGPWLLEFYGPDGWYDAETADVIRKESPAVLPYGDWRDSGPSDLVRPELDNLPWAPTYRQRWNIDPGQTSEMGTPVFSVFLHLKDPLEIRIAHYLCVLVAVLFTLGVATRITSVLALLAALGYIHRTPVSLFGQDCMLMILLLYLAIGPSGSALSVDALVRRYRLALAGLRLRKQVPDLSPEPAVSATVALRLLQIHFCIIYLASGMSKMQGAAWWNGTALWQTVANYEFAPPAFAFFTPMLRFLTEHRWMWELAMSGGCLFTIALELGLPFLIWNPRWRWLCIIGAVLLHTGIAVMMGLNAFSLFMICIVLSFVPAAVVKERLDWLLTGRTHLWLLFSSRRGGGVRLAALVEALDVGAQVTLVDVAARHEEADLPGWLHVPVTLDHPRLLLEEGQAYSGYPLLERLGRALRLLWPVALLGAVPGVGALGRRLRPGEEPMEKREAVAAGRE